MYRLRNVACMPVNGRSTCTVRMGFFGETCSIAKPATVLTTNSSSGLIARGCCAATGNATATSYFGNIPWQLWGMWQRAMS